MQYRDALIVDYGPDFHGQAVRTDNGIVCAVPSQLHVLIEGQAEMRELVTALGGSCGECQGCPIGSLG